MGNKISRRNFLILMGASAAAFALTGCSETEIGADLPQLSGHSLVIYFSGTGNTRRVAQAGAEALGADIYEITPVQPYTSADLNYYDRTSRVIAEHNDPSLRPEIAGALPDLMEYDNVFIGYPLWNADLPMPLYSFFEEYDLNGKTIIPFTVHGGSSFAGTRQTIAELEPDATVVNDGLSISRNSVAEAEASVVDWVQGLGLSQ